MTLSVEVATFYRRGRKHELIQPEWKGWRAAELHANPSSPGATLAGFTSIALPTIEKMETSRLSRARVFTRIPDQ